ncbi:P-loop ATPase, Sll1717 family [Paenibacillus periandrae]|uniref:P-loop ATPase, Sll1717 family n=1 Tax=Paenibacillus periandrae TaxID=1761741 RepID=UPI001F088CA4|nr:hypothetical protein [Paenibacillus periandrae]
MNIKKAFYAYSSQRRDLLEDIRTAVKLINENNNVLITTWEDLAVSGKYIVTGILNAIEQCDLFICDLTYLNYNVLYELGYAISKEKKIWITLNSSHSKASANYKSLSPLTTIGYAGYQNSKELVEKFYSDVPYEYTDAPDIRISQGGITRNLVYLKCEAHTNASSTLENTLTKYQIPTKQEDPYEGHEPLSWYLEFLPNAFGVIIHFHTIDSNKESSVDVARKALIAGLSKGLGLKTLLLAHAPFYAPLDYHDELKIHSTAAQCEPFIKAWLDPISEKYRDLEEDHREYKADQKAMGKISSLIMGDYVAENESHDLMEYFLETAEYNEALKAQQVLFVGRKGTGKTANLMKLKTQMASDKRNFVIPIQPQGHEFEGVLDILSKLINNSEQGHFIESIWKYLIYTEMARKYYEYLENQPLHFQKTEDEKSFERFVSDNQRLIDADFTLRLENVINDLKALEKSDTIEQQRLKVSEYLHSNMIHHLRGYLGKVLAKREDVKILIDNLDKGWNDNADLGNLSDLLFGLLNVVHRITDDFQHNSYKYTKVNLSLVVFLRSDIFSRIMSHAPERDKIATKYLNWSDPHLLFRVIEKRIDYSSNGVTSPEALWNDYFCEQVDGLPLKTYIENLIIPRPRDIIFLFKMALQEAVNRNHKKVEEEDFKSAEYSYSEYALQSLFPENGNRVKDLESILYEFAGQRSIINQEELEDSLKINKEIEAHQLVTILCEMTFLGLEVQPDKFEYYSDKKPPQITNKLAQRLAEKNGRSKRYEINPAFHAYLGIEK